MTNFEKYKDEIVDAFNNCTLGMFIKNKLHDESYYEKDALGTYEIIKLFMWLNEEYKEPEVDWSKVAIDTPVLVKKEDDLVWKRRYFAKFESGEVYTWINGATSWSENISTRWDYAKLAEDGE